MKKKVLALMLALTTTVSVGVPATIYATTDTTTEAEEGTASNPASLTVVDAAETRQSSNEVTISAGGTYYYEWTPTEDGTLTIKLGETTSTFIVSDSTQSLQVMTGLPASPSMNVTAGSKVTICAKNRGNDDTLIFFATFEKAESDEGGDTTLVLGENEVSVPADDGRDYTYTSETATTIKLTALDDDYYFAPGMYCSSLFEAFGGRAAGKSVEFNVAAGQTVTINVSKDSYAAGKVKFKLEVVEEEKEEEEEEEEGGSTVTPGNGSGTLSIPQGENKVVEWTASADGVLTVEANSDGGFWYKPADSIAYDMNSVTKVEESYAVTADTTYEVGFWAIGGDRTIEYSLSFTEGGSVKEEYVISDYIIGLDGDSLDGETAGEYHVTHATVGTHEIPMEENGKMTIVKIAPEATGYYKVTVSGDAQIGNCNTLTYIIIPSAEEMGSKMEWVCEETGHYYDNKFEDGATEQRWQSGQSILMGIVSDAETVSITIEKTAEYVPEEIPVVTYENKATLKPFELSGCQAAGEYVDVYSGNHSAVLGEDGYYHLDAADGPILLVDLDYKNIVLSDALFSERPVMQVIVTGEDGKKVCYDIGSAVTAYEAVADDNGYYPLTEDLIFFYKDYGMSSGIYSFYLTKPGYNEDCVWMYCCLTVASNHKAGEWVIDKAPTVDAEGSRHMNCTVCGAVLKEETLDKLQSSSDTEVPKDNTVVTAEEIAKLDPIISGAPTGSLKASTVSKEAFDKVQAFKNTILKDRTYQMLDLKLVGENDVVMQPDGTVAITLSVMDKLKDSKTIEVFRLDDTTGELKSLGKYEVKNGKFTFNTDHFSTYVFADATSTSTSTDTTTNTGDSAPVVPIMAVAAVSVAAVVVSRKKKTVEE